MWEEKDKKNFDHLTRINKGQITNDAFSKNIKNISSDINNKTFLEIGTWNGLGSTKCFVDELVKRTDNYIFYSLECNKEKNSEAKKLYEGLSNIFLLNEVIFNNQPENFYDIFPECKKNIIFNLHNNFSNDI